MNYSDNYVNREAATSTFGELKADVSPARQIISSGHDLSDETLILAKRVEALADKIVGTEPENGGCTEATPPVSCVFDELQRAQRAQRSALFRIGYALDRLERAFS
ncbi:MAG: hypothetical protein IH622_13495 [Ochrobactrum anthropi]|uniref:Uncharacterized protein n=1 Tax=Brucella anthropi TaxID=529 RepID=A0A8I0TB20_BRUAN|nr:hypothetical protein [Brucella anthropi]MBE0561811.1 hypothetical protein [Brucella anthropi]